MVSYRRVLNALRGFSPVYDDGKEKTLHLLLGQHLASIFEHGSIELNLTGKKAIDILVGKTVAIEVKRRIPSYRTLYRQLKTYRRLYKRRKIILYIYSGLDKSKKNELKLLREKDIVDKIIVNTTIIKYKSEKEKIIIFPPKPVIIEIPP